MPILPVQPSLHKHPVFRPYGRQPAGPLLLLPAPPAMVPDVAPVAVLSDDSDGDPTESMSQTFSYARLTCMTVGAALALVRHVHACGTCMLRQMHMCSMCMGAALAWLQHVHGGGICMGAARAW